MTTTTTTSRIDAETGETVYTNVTLVAPSMFGAYNATFCKELRVVRRPFAQHPEALFATYKAPRQRLYRRCDPVKPDSSPVFILEGNHSQLKQELFGDVRDAGDGCSVSNSRHSAFAAEWGAEIEAAIAAGDVKVLDRYGRES